jgi:hypothetical protein
MWANQLQRWDGTIRPNAVRASAGLIGSWPEAQFGVTRHIQWPPPLAGSIMAADICCGYELLGVKLTEPRPKPTRTGASTQVTVSGRIRHSEMNAVALMDRIRRHFPQVEASDYDFTIPMGDCRAQFVCGNIGNLDFRIVPSVSDGARPSSTASAVTSVEMLVRTTDKLWPDVRKSLTTKYLRKRPILTECRIEDTQSKFTLLIRDTESPLASSGAKIAYAMSLIFCLAAIPLVFWQVKIHQSADTRTANILAIALTLGAAAVSVPIPIVVNWRDWKKSLPWRYARIG